MQHSVAFFGKVPASADFVSHNIEGEELRTLDKWFYEGMSYAAGKLTLSAADMSAAPCYYFVFPFDEFGTVLVGSFKLSRDKIGRVYPFIVCIKLGDDFLTANAPTLIVNGVWSWLKASAEILTKATTGDSPGQLAEKVDVLVQASIFDDSMEAIELFMETTTVEQLLETVANRLTGLHKYVLYKNLIDILSQLEGVEFRSLRLGLRFPIKVAPGETPHIVSYWLQTVGKLVGELHKIPALLWSESQEKPDYLYFFVNSPDAKVLAQLLDPSFELDSICLLEQDGSEEIEISALPDRLRNALDSPADSIQMLLETVATLHYLPEKRS